MSDCSPAAIEIGGKLPASELERLVQAINWVHAHLDYGDYADVELSDVLAFVGDGKPLDLKDDQVTYGMFEELEDYCRQVGLTYRRHSDAYGEWDAHLVFWQPGMEKPAETASDNSGRRLVSEDDLRRFAGEGKSVTEVIAWLEQLAGPEKLPALELVA